MVHTTQHILKCLPHLTCLANKQTSMCVNHYVKGPLNLPFLVKYIKSIESFERKCSLTKFYY